MYKINNDYGYPFLMNPKEIKLLHQFASQSKNYLEFGSGGSTLYVLDHSGASITSVDSYEIWVLEMMKYKSVKDAVASKRLEFYYANIGKTLHTGYPDGNASKELYPTYSKSVFDNINGGEVDLVLIDGRFRVACTLQTILHCPSAKIAIHDFCNRPEYHVVLDYLEEVESADSLGVFHVRAGADRNVILLDYDRYKYDPY
jgi:hypothetical protein